MLSVKRQNWVRVIESSKAVYFNIRRGCYFNGRVKKASTVVANISLFLVIMVILIS